MSDKDEELEALRQRRMQQLQSQMAAGQQQDIAMAAQQAEMDRRQAEQKEILRKVMTPDARERLGRIRLAKPEAAAAVEQQIMALAISGRIQRPIDDATLRAILERIMSDKREITITRR
jgi:programmed cell death protein 5